MENKNMNFKPTNMAQNQGQGFEAKMMKVVSIMKQLSSLIETENKAIKGNDFDKVKSLQEDKQKLAHAYSEGFKTLGSYKDLMKSLPQNSRVEVIKTSDRLEKAMQDNVLFIKASISASKTLLENIVKSAESSEQENKGFYSRSGKMGSDSKYRSALSVNQVL